LRRLLILSAMLAVCFSFGCAAMPDEREAPFAFNYEGTKTDDKPVIVFFADGVRRDTFDKLLVEGRLPNMKKFFIDRGFVVQNAFTVMPTITHSVTTSMVTGFVPGRHGITGIHWFDRKTLIARDYGMIAQKNTLDGDYSRRTIFAAVPDGWTMAIFMQPHKGVTRWIENWMSAGPPYWFGWFCMVDRISMIRFSINARLARERGRFARLTFVHLIAPDAFGHQYGPDSKAYRDAIVHTDAQIGRLLKNLEAHDVLDKILLVFISDHGMVETRRKLNVQDLVKRKFDIAAAEKFLWEKDTNLGSRLAYYGKFNAVVVGSGGRYTDVHFRKPAPAGGFHDWLTRPSFDDLTNYPTRSGAKVNLVRKFAERPEVGHVLVRENASTVRLFSADGNALIEQNPEGGIRYKVCEGADPLGLCAHGPAKALMDARFHPKGRWAEAALGSAYPGVITQAVDFMRSPRSGDIVLFAGDGFGFAPDPAGNSGARPLGGHGGISAAEFAVPMIFAGPGMKGRKVDMANVVDLAPTLMDYWGFRGALGSDLDGASVFAETPKGN